MTGLLQVAALPKGDYELPIVAPKKTLAILTLASLLTIPLGAGIASAAAVPAGLWHHTVFSTKAGETSSESHIAGTVTAVTSSDVTINGTAYPLAGTVSVVYHDHQLTVAQIPVTAVVSATLNAAGQITKIELQTNPGLPSGESVSGAIQSITSTTLQIGSYTLPLASTVTVNYHDHQLTLAQVPTGANAKVVINSAGQVTKIHLLSDPSLPRGESYTGTISAVSSGDIQIGSYTLTLASSVTVKYHDHRLTVSQVPVGVQAKVSINHAGQVTKIKLLSDPALPAGESTTGTIQQITASTIQVGTYMLPLASSVTVTYHDYQLTLAQVPVGSTAKVKINRAGQVTKVKLRSDPALPGHSTFTGTITGLTGNTLQVGSYTLTLAPQVKVKYGSFDHLSTLDIPMQVTAQIHINSQLQVTKIKLQSDPSLPASNTLVGTLSAISSTSVTIDGYTLPIEPSVHIPNYHGQTYTVTQLQPGWTVKVKIDSQGMVRKIKIRSGPTSPSPSPSPSPSTSPSPSPS